MSLEERKQPFPSINHFTDTEGELQLSAKGIEGKRQGIKYYSLLSELTSTAYFLLPRIFIHKNPLTNSMYSNEVSITCCLNGEGGNLPPSVPPYRTVPIRVISYDNATSFVLFLEAFLVQNLTRPSTHNLTKLFLLTSPRIAYNAVYVFRCDVSICINFRDLSAFKIEKIAGNYIQFYKMTTTI